MGMERRSINLNEKGNEMDANYSLATLAGYNMIEEMQSLIDKGADVNERHGFGLTPLHTATWAGKNDAVKMLIENGADVNAKDRAGHTPFSYGIKVSEFNLNRSVKDPVIITLKEHGAK